MVKAYFSHNEYIKLLLIGEFLIRVFGGSSNCRERTRLIGTDKSDMFTLVDAQKGQEVKLECHYCNEHDDHEPKVWFKQDILLKEPPSEVRLGMANKEAQNRLKVTPDHTLVFKNVTTGDEGLYFCHGIHGEEAKNKFNYVLDLVSGNDSLVPFTGNLTKWLDYHEKYIKPLSQRLKVSRNPEIVRLREELGIQLEVVSEWQHWGPCLSCNRPQGVRTRDAKCRFKPTIHENFTRDPSGENDKVDVLLNVYQLSCQSEILNSVIPGLSELTRRVPDFVREEECVGRCNQVELDEYNRTSPNKTTRALLKKRYILTRHSHLVLVCPTMTMESLVEWRKDGDVIDAASAYHALTHDLEEPRVAIDTFSTLYLHDVTPEQAGNYTCFLDGTIVQAVDVKVVAKSLLLSHAFARHLAYIGCAFLLTFICYCARIAVVCTRRHKFLVYSPMTPQQYREDVENMSNNRNGDESSERDDDDD